MFYRDGGTKRLIDVTIGEEVVVDSRSYGTDRYRFGKVIKLNKRYATVEYPTMVDGKEVLTTAEFTLASGTEKGESHIVGRSASGIVSRPAVENAIVEYKETIIMKRLRNEVLSVTTSQNVNKLTKAELRDLYAMLTR